MCWKQRSTLQHPYCRALINLFPPISRPKRPPSTRASADESTGPTRTLAYYPLSPGDLPALVRAFDGTTSEFRAFTAALLLHCGTAAWILEIAPSHFATLSTSKQAEVTESQEDFLTAYGRIGSTAAHHHTVDPTTDSKRHALLSARVRQLSELLRSPFPLDTCAGA